MLKKNKSVKIGFNSMFRLIGARLQCEAHQTMDKNMLFHLI